MTNQETFYRWTKKIEGMQRHLIRVEPGIYSVEGSQTIGTGDVDVLIHPFYDEIYHRYYVDGLTGFLKTHAGILLALHDNGDFDHSMERILEAGKWHDTYGIKTYYRDSNPSEVLWEDVGEFIAGFQPRVCRVFGVYLIEGQTPDKSGCVGWAAHQLALLNRFPVQIIPDFSKHWNPKKD